MKIFFKFFIVFFFLFIIVGQAPLFAQTTTKKVQITLKEVTPVENDKIKSTIEWDGVASGDHYYETYSKTGNSDYELLGNLASSPLVLTFSQDRPSFSIKVREVTSKGPGEFSNEVVVTWNKTPLGIPTNISVQKQQTSDTTIEATIKWNAVSKATKYYVYTVFDGNKQKIGETTGTESKISYGKYGSSFSIGISSANDSTESALSALFQIDREQYVNPTAVPSPTSQTASTLTSAPTNIRIVSQEIKNDKKNIELLWDSLAGSRGYYVYISTNGEFTKLSGVTLNSVIISVPIHFVSFKIGVKGINEKGESPLSNPIEIKDEETKIDIEFKDSKVASSTRITPSPTPKVKEVLDKIEINEVKPKEQQASILGTSVKGDLGPNIEKKKPNNNFIASFFSSIIHFFTSLWN